MHKNRGYDPPKSSGKILLTMNAIVDYYGRDRKTIIDLIKNDNFPAIFDRGRWQSHTDLVDDYAKRKITDKTERMSSAA